MRWAGRSVVNQSKQQKKLCPGAETLVHGVRIERGILAEPLVEPGERVVAHEGLVLGQHAAFLGVQQKNQAQDHGEQPTVDVVAVTCGGEQVAQKLAAGGVVSDLNATQEFIQRMEHLLGESLRDLVLVLAAALEQSGETLLAWQRQQALFGEEQAQGGAERASGIGDEVCEAKVHPSGALAARGRDQPQGNAVDQNAGGNAGTAQQALRTALGRRFQSAGTGGRPIELLPVVEYLHQQLPRWRAVAGISLANREVGAQRLTVVGEGNRQLVRDRRLLGASVAPWREAPPKNGARKIAEVAEAGFGFAYRRERALFNAARQQRLSLSILPVQDRPRLDQGRSGDHQTVRLDESQPFEMSAGVRIWRRHCHQPRGIRQRSRVARSRRCASVTLAFLAVV